VKDYEVIWKVLGEILQGFVGYMWAPKGVLAHHVNAQLIGMSAIYR
jgi:hypothetical protein